jgi:hypothetical protein
MGNHFAQVNYMPIGGLALPPWKIEGTCDIDSLAQIQHPRCEKVPPEKCKAARCSKSKERKRTKTKS